MTFEIACEKIFASAKKRFDYIAYEDEFIDFFGTEKGALIASNLVTEVMIGLADGKTIDEIASALNMQMMAAGVRTDIAAKCKTIEEATKIEQEAFVMLRVYDQMGMRTEDAFAEVRESLAYPRPFTDKQKALMEQVCLSQILASAKKSIRSFETCRQAEMAQRPDNADRRMDSIVRYVLGFLSSDEQVEIGQIYDFLVGKMAKGTVPEWLMDFLQEAKTSVDKELCAMNAMSIGWEIRLPVEKIAIAVKYRLEH